MADDPNPQLREKLNAALDILTPQLDGLHVLVGVSFTDDLLAQLTNQLGARIRRRDLSHGAINAIDALRSAMEALEADGWPELSTAPLPKDLLDELKLEMAHIKAAADVFAAEQAAKRIAVDLGTATTKPDTRK